jgi:RNA polymerase sigma-70 factor (ECF subfamily)
MRAGAQKFDVLLGWSPDAEDVVQDATLVALSRLGDLRDPAAAGPWLRAITRNTARMRLRSAGRATTLETSFDLPAREPTPDEMLEAHALRNWVWSALEGLSEPLQLVVLLRYFTGTTSYEQIAALCEVPVGTVRSRLNQARGKLGSALRASADAAHSDTTSIVSRRRNDAEDLLSSATRGQFRATLATATVPDLLLIGPQGQRTRGRAALAHIMDNDLGAGVRQRLNHVTASRRITILECDLVSPPWDPQHCPQAVLWLMTRRDTRIEKIRLFHPAAEATTADGVAVAGPG